MEDRMVNGLLGSDGDQGGDIDYEAPLLRGLVYTSLSSTGFLLSVLASYLMLRFMVGGESGARGLGRFGRFMVMVEVMDAIPESIILANAAVEDNISYAFLAAISVTNFVSSLASSCDLMATRGSRNLHRILLALNVVGIGMLSHSVPIQTFQAFKNESRETGDWTYGVGWIAGGLVTGAAFVLALTVMEDRMVPEVRSMEPSEMATLRSIMSMIGRQLSKGGTQGGWQDVDIEAEVEEDDLIEEGTFEGAEEEEEETIKGVEKDKEEDPRPGGDGDPIPGLVARYMELRDEKIRAIVAKTKEGLRVLDHMEERGSRSGSQWILEGVDQMEEDELRGGFIEGTSGVSMFRRMSGVFLMFLGLFLWSLCLAVAFVYLFAWLKRDHRSLQFYGDSLAEGVSAGAFLASLAGTLLPRLMQDAYGSSWPLLTTKIVCVVTFISGLGLSVALDMLESFVGL